MCLEVTTVDLAEAPSDILLQIGVLAERMRDSSLFA